jgi:3-keto-L-gulonate-6-phosphate decarboxylase
MPEYITGEDGEQYEVQTVEAVGVCATASHVSTKVGDAGAKFIQAAMTAAVEECYKHGVTEPDTVREAMMLARERAKKAIMEALKEVTPEGNTEG